MCMKAQFGLEWARRNHKVGDTVVALQTGVATEDWMRCAGAAQCGPLSAMGKEYRYAVSYALWRVSRARAAACWQGQESKGCKAVPGAFCKLRTVLAS